MPAASIPRERRSFARIIRAYGTYSRVLGTYVRDEGIITLEDAVRKASGAVAGKARTSLRQSF